jgi:hypothetical protein
VKFDPVFVNFAVSKGCGMLIREVLCATTRVLVGSESVELGESEVSVALSTVVRAVVVAVLFSAPSVTVANTVVATAESSLLAETRAIADKRRATRNKIRGRWKRGDLRELLNIELHSPFTQVFILKKTRYAYFTGLHQLFNTQLKGPDTVVLNPQTLSSLIVLANLD